jgi:hypothetical protein
MLNDPGMAEALETVREIHVIRLKLQDEKTGMTSAEEAENISTKKRGHFLLQ